MTTPRTTDQITAAIADLTPTEIRSAIFRLAQYDTRQMTKMLDILDNEREFAASLNSRPMIDVDYRIETIPGTNLLYAQCLCCDTQTAEYRFATQVYRDIDAHVQKHWTDNAVSHERFTL